MADIVTIKSIIGDSPAELSRLNDINNNFTALTLTLSGNSLSISSLTPTTLTAGSVLYSNGADISQDNAAFLWDNSYSPAGTLQIGTKGTNPEDATLEVYANSGQLAHFHYTGSASPTGGAIQDLSAMSGSALASGSRLGSLQFAGSYDTSYVPGIGAAINGVTTQAWSSGKTGGQLVFNTVPNNSTTRTTALTLNQDQTAQLNAYTTNGFMKFTGSNGTIGTDTNTYITQNQTIIMTGDVSATGSNTLANTINNNVVTNAKLAQAGANTYKGNNSSITNNLSDIPTNTAFNQNFETSTSNIKMDGSVSVGSSSNLVRSDHVHPIDTSRQASLGYTPLNPANNLTDVSNTATALSNLGGVPLPTTSGNTIFGYETLANNTAVNTTGIGYYTLYNNTTGGSNTAVGYICMYYNSTGSYNTAFGYQTIKGTSGHNVSYDTAIGYEALFYDYGGYNTGIGYKTLYSNTTGSGNIALGYEAGYNDSTALATGTYNTYLGYGANANADGLTNSTAIGNGAQVTASNQVVIGNSNVTSTVINGTIPQQAWQTPTFLNSWAADADSVNYMKDSMGFVHLRGAINSGTAGTTVYVLPVGYRPQQIVYTLGQNSGINPCYFQIQTNGNVVLESAYSIAAGCGMDSITFATF